MSAPLRGAGTNRARSTTPPTTRGRGSRGASRPFQPRGRGRGISSTTTRPGGAGLLQGLQSGTIARRGTENGISRGARGRGTSIRGASSASRGLSTRTPKTFTTSKAKAPIAPASNVDFMTQATARFETLKRNREAERAKAIKDGFLADPDKKTTLDNAITPVGTCTEMCPAFERVERIVQRMVDKSEKSRDDSTKPDEERMVKRFRRSAAGYDEQLPSDIRTPTTLKMTLDYLLDEIVGGGARLASIHKFVWDRTRGIRNDFSIQQVTKKEDVQIAVECLERIARFHILSLHQLSNPDNLVGEQFDAHQDREQLNNTLLSLIYYYDDNSHLIDFPNEAEFRAYCIIFELQSHHPDIEDRMQSWPRALLEDGRVKTAFRLYAAAGNTVFDQGPLKPPTTFSSAQGNTGSFWSILSSKQVSYLMACVAEIYFGQVRYMALQALWTAATSAPAGTRAKNQDWTLEELANVLGFDAEEQAAGFCEDFGLKISTNDDGLQYLDVSLNKALDKSSIPKTQVFSYGIVEAKRFRRTLMAVINGKTVPQAVREGLVEMDEDQQGTADYNDVAADDESLFVPEKQAVSANPFAKAAEQVTANPFAKPVEQVTGNPFARTTEEASTFTFGNPATSAFNPQAPAFAPGMLQQPSGVSASPGPFNPFVTKSAQASTNPFTNSGSPFPSTAPAKVDSPTTAAKTANPFSKINSGNGSSFTPQSTPPKSISQPFVFGAEGFNPSPTAAPVNSLPATSTATTPNNSFSFTPFTSPTSTWISTPSQPPAFSWPKVEENTQENIQNTGAADPSLRDDFHPSSTNHFLGPTTTPPGMVQGHQHTQAASPQFKKPMLPRETIGIIGVPDPAQYLQLARSAGPVKFSVAPNGPSEAFDIPAKTWPRRFPEVRTPGGASTPNSQDPPSSPLGRLGAAMNPFVVDDSDTEADTTTNTSAPPAPPPKRVTFEDSSGPPDNCTTQSNSQQQEQLSPPPRAGFPWSDPTVPGYPRSPSPKALAPKPKEPRTDAERQIIVDALAHLAMTQAQANLMDELVKFLVPGIIDEAIAQYNTETHASNSRIIKEEYLRKKYGNRMKAACLLRKKRTSRDRRLEGFAEMERLEKAAERIRRKKRAELEEIKRAVQESEMLKAEIRAIEGRQKIDETRREQRATAQAADLREVARPARIRGQKRKSDATDDGSEARLDLAGRPYMTRHKRSKTEVAVDNDQDSDEAYERYQVRLAYIRQQAVGRSLFSRTLSKLGTQPASENPRQRNVDTTKTDYFRLKARGINPETPIIPLTARQVEQQHEQVKGEKARRAVEPKPWQGKSTLRRLSIDTKLSDFDMAPPAKPVSKPLPTPTPSPATGTSAPDLLETIQTCKKEQQDDAEWFKVQRQTYDKQFPELPQKSSNAKGKERAGASVDDAIELESDDSGASDGDDDAIEFDSDGANDGMESDSDYSGASDYVGASADDAIELDSD